MFFMFLMCLLSVPDFVTLFVSAFAGQKGAPKPVFPYFQSPWANAQGYKYFAPTGL
jgi:hypothetical protein